MDFETDISKCLTVLNNGGVILYPTDTVWGIGCDATNANAVEKVFNLKNRPGEKAMIVLLADEREIKKYITQPDFQVFDYLKTVTKPTTVIYQGAVKLAENLIAPDGSIAIRLTRDIFCSHLIRRFRKPIVSTSANISGSPTARVFSEINDTIKKGADYIVQYRQEDDSAAEPSSLIRWEKGGPVILRP